MKKQGGVLHGEWEMETTENGQLRRRCPAIAWGAVTDDVYNREANTKNGKNRYVQFRIRLKKKEFIRCTIYANNPFYWAAQRLKKGDFVFIAGRLTAWSYTNNEGQSKISIDTYPQFILTQDMISKITEIDLEPDPILGDDEEPDESGEIAWSPFDAGDGQ